MRRAIWLAPAFCGVMIAAGALAGDLKSGPEVGGKIVVPFNPLHCNGANAGQKVCLV
jgi:hypothetical protein